MPFLISIQFCIAYQAAPGFVTAPCTGIVTAHWAKSTLNNQQTNWKWTGSKTLLIRPGIDPGSWEGLFLIADNPAADRAVYSHVVG